VGLSKNYLWTWKYGSQEVKYTFIKKACGPRYSLGSQLVAGKTLYWLDAVKPGVYSFNAETMTEQRKPPKLANK